MLALLLRHYKTFLLKERCPSPLLFFACYAFRHLYQEEDTLWLFHVLALFMLILQNFNMLYMLPSFIYVKNDVLSALLLLPSLLGCNKKWKMYLFLFVIGDSYIASSSFQSQYLAAGSLSLCIAIYSNLMFQTNAENEQYFVGFFVIFTIDTTLLFTEAFQIQLHFLLLAMLALVSAGLAKMVFSIRINQIRALQLEKLRDLSIMPKYIDQLIEDFKVPQKMMARLEVHQKSCRQVACFCKNVQYKHRGEYYLQQMLENLMKRLGNLGDDQLWSYYIDFYLKKNQVLTAYYYLLKWRPSSYFSIISKLRCEAKIAIFLQKKNFFNPFIKQYVYGLQYDQKCLHLSTEIHEILKMKIDFWKQVGKQELSLLKLQTLGCKIVRKMYELNKFYNYVIKEQERYLYCFDSTVLYGMYLISATNFKDYAKAIIKSTSKQMEEACLSQMNASQTFVIRAVIKNTKQSYMKQQNSHFEAEKEIVTELQQNSNFQNDFKLIIDAVSVGLCRMLNVQRQEMIGCQLHTLIPNCFKEVHNARISQILDFKSESIKYVPPAKVLHVELTLMFRGANDELFSGLICIKYHMDINEGVTFLSIIKKTAEKGAMALASFDGVLMEKEKNFPPDVLKHPIVRKYIADMKEIWVRDYTIKEERFSLMMDRVNYEVSIDSPFAFLILDKDGLKEKVLPPLHIQLTSQDTTLRKTTASYKPNNQADDQIRKMEKLINEDQHSSVASSTKGAQSAINVISNFSQNNVVPIYSSIIFAFLLIVICNFGLNLTFNLMKPLPWDNISPIGNAIVTNARFLLFPVLHSRAALNLQDLVFYKQYSNIINETQLASFYSGQNYSDQMAEMFGKIRLQMGGTMRLLYNGSSQLVWPAIQQSFLTNLIVPNVYDQSISSQVPTQFITYFDVILLYSTDLNMLSKKRSQDLVLMPFIYREVEAQTADYALVADIISSSIDHANTKQLTIGLSFIALAVLLLIPMMCMLHKRLKIHERVFDLLSSIEGMQVKRQIECLLYISNILHNYSESRQQLKTNMMEYELNTRHPKHKQERDRRSSVVNEMVMGLEKYDLASNSHSSNVNSSEMSLVTKIKHNPYLSKKPKAFNNVKNRLFLQMTKEAKFQPRKRAGELDLSGSQLDNKNKIIPKHCLVYLLLLSFVPFLLYTLITNLSGVAATRQVHSTVYDCYINLINNNIKLYTAKAYLWQGNSKYKSSSNLSDQLLTLTSLLNKRVSYQTHTNKQKDLIQSSNNTKLSENLISLRLIEGKIVSTMKSLVEYRYKFENSQQSNHSQNYTDLPHKFYEDIIYLQKLSNQRQIVTKAMMARVLQDMYAKEEQTNQKRRLSWAVLILWSVCCFVAGLLVTLRMKRQFFEEMYILTFLSEEMLLGNKRVESFIDNLSKNTYY